VAALLFLSKNETSPIQPPLSVVNSEQTEFDDAMATDTIPALEAFVKKNSNSPLVKTAEREREKIAQRLEEEATGRGATLPVEIGDSLER